MEATALEAAIAAAVFTAAAGRRLASVAGRRGVALALVLGSQLALWLLKRSGEVVLYPWEYMFLYSPVLWALYSSAKALAVAAAARRRLLGLFLLSAVLAQPAATLLNIEFAPPLRTATLRVCNETLKAVVADTKLRMACGYYCWPNAEAVAFTGAKPGKARITMMGVTKPLLLLVIAANDTLVSVRLLKPWHIYTIHIPRGALVAETAETHIELRPGCPASLSQQH